jgi:uncharacterized FlaG/YvyC family protein
MDFGGVNKPAAPTSQSALQRADAPVSSGFAKTELPKEATVQPVEEISPVRFQPSAGSDRRAELDAVMQRAVERKMEADERTRDLVFRAVNEKTGEVVLQLPSEQALKLRAYLQESTARIADASGGRAARPVVA